MGIHPCFRVFYQCLTSRDYVGRYGVDTPRKTNDNMNLKVDKTAKPLLEKLKLSVLIDKTNVVKVIAESTMESYHAELEISNLEFALRAQTSDADTDETDNGSKPGVGTVEKNSYPAIRSIVISHEGRKGQQYIAGDIVNSYYDSFDLGRPVLTSKQVDEQMYYAPCSLFFLWQVAT